MIENMTLWVFRNAFICVGACCGTSVFVGFVLFCYLGHMAHVQNKNITEIAEQGEYKSPRSLLFLQINVAHST